MPASDPSRRPVTVLILVLFVVGAFVVLGWVLRVALVALSLAIKVSGFVLFAVIVYVLVRALSKKG